MIDKDVFFTSEQEAKILNAEIKEIKELLRELMRKINKIESRARRAYPSVFPKKPSHSDNKITLQSAKAANMSKEQLLRLFDEVVQKTKEENKDEAKKLLADTSYPDLNLLRIELGVTLKNKKPSRAILLKAINGRVNESIMLNKHTNRPM